MAPLTSLVRSKRTTQKDEGLKMRMGTCGPRAGAAAPEDPQEEHLQPRTAPQVAAVELPPGPRGISGHLSQGRESAKARKLTRALAKREMAEERSVCVFGFATLRLKSSLQPGFTAQTPVPVA